MSFELSGVTYNSLSQLTAAIEASLLSGNQSFSGLQASNPAGAIQDTDVGALARGGQSCGYLFNSLKAYMGAPVAVTSVANVAALAALDPTGLNFGDIVAVATPPLAFIPMKYYSFIKGSKPYNNNNLINVVNASDGMSQFACFNYGGIDNLNYITNEPYPAGPFSTIVKCTNGLHTLTPIAVSGTAISVDFIKIPLPVYAQSQVIPSDGIFDNAKIILNGGYPVSGYMQISPSLIQMGKTTPLNVASFATDTLQTWGQFQDVAGQRIFNNDAAKFQIADVCGFTGQQISYPLL